MQLHLETDELYLRANVLMQRIGLHRLRKKSMFW
jgi:hypothetical protein